MTKHWSQQPVPFVKTSDTSREAAESMVPHVIGLRAKVYAALMEAGERGMTDEELQTMFNTYSVRPRRVHLERIGAVYRTDETRLTKAKRKATVFFAQPGVDIDQKAPKTGEAPPDALTEKVTVYLTKAQKAKLQRIAAQDARSLGFVARHCMGIGWQQLADSRRFFDNGGEWEHDKI